MKKSVSSVNGAADAARDKAMRYHKKQQKREDGGGLEAGAPRVEGAVGALVRPAHLAYAQDVERGGVEGFHVEFLRTQRLNENSLAGSG